MNNIFSILNNHCKIKKDYIEQLYNSINDCNIIHYNDGIKCCLSYTNENDDNDDDEKLKHKSIIPFADKKTNNNILIINDIALLFIGDIFNYKHLISLLDIEVNMNCEVIIHLYIKYGIEYTLNLLNGTFSFILYDFRILNNSSNSKIYIARDPYGLKKLFLLSPENITSLTKIQNTKSQSRDTFFAISSNLHLLENINYDNTFTIQEIIPATYVFFELKMLVCSQWEIQEINKYYKLPSAILPCNNITKINNIDYINYTLMSLFIQSVNNQINYIEDKSLKRACLMQNTKASIFLNSYLRKNFTNINIFCINVKGDNIKETEYIEMQSILKKNKIYVTEIIITLEDIQNAINSFRFLNKENAIMFLFISYLKINNYKYFYSEYGFSEFFENNSIKSFEEEIKNVSRKKILKSKNLLSRNLIDSVDLNTHNKTFHNNILDYDKYIREKILNIYSNKTFEIINKCADINNIIIFFPFIEKDFINYYVTNHLLIKKQNNNKIPKNFRVYINYLL